MCVFRKKFTLILLDNFAPRINPSQFLTSKKNISKEIDFEFSKSSWITLYLNQQVKNYYRLKFISIPASKKE